MGGFGSCTVTNFHGDWESPAEMPMMLEVKRIYNELREEFGTDFDIFGSCFTKLSELRVRSSDDSFKKLYINQVPENVASTIRRDLSHVKTRL